MKKIKMTEQNLHDYNKWLTEVWSKQFCNIPFMADAPKAYLKYRTEQFRLGVVRTCVLGDRVEDNNTKSLGIVIDLDVLTNAGGEEPLAKVHWTDCSKSLIGNLEDGWICEGNLTMIESGEDLLHRNH